MAVRKKTLKICSLFSGCGGLDLGLIGGFQFLGVKYPKTGMKLVWAADNNPDAIDTMKANTKYFGRHIIKHLYEEDLREFEDYDSIPDFDVLAAGFPCQPFSNAGNRGGINDKHGRGTLFEICERIINTLPKKRRPLAYIFENVKGILSTFMPNGKTVPDEISTRMSALGYNCSGPVMIKSQEYGVPQQRHRVFIIGLNKNLNKVFDYSQLKKYVKKESLNKLTVQDAISNVEYLPDSKEVWDLSPQAKYMASKIKRSWKDIPYEKLPLRFQRIRDNMDRYRAPNFYRRFSLGEINGTITAAAQPENCGILHPIENRRYSIREIARIQSFPDDFVFKAKTTRGKYKIIGNAVPPILGYVIGRALSDVILENKDGCVSYTRSNKMVNETVSLFAE